MRLMTACVLSACAFFAAMTPVSGADAKNKDAGDDVFTRFDTNKNGVLDPDEIAALRAAFKNGDASLKAYDTNGDGMLDENEIAAIKPPEKGRKKKK